MSDFTASTETLIGTLVPAFESFPRIARLSRDVIISEKIDGTNAQIFIDDSGTVLKVGSRNRWLRDCEDNYGFYKWAMEHRDELLTLGPGRHFGEWFGAGIQRGYGLKEKRFALFNVHRWADSQRDVIPGTGKDFAPLCCTVVPVLYRGPFSESAINSTMSDLRVDGSAAVEGYDNPEGIVVYHTAAKCLFKKTFNGDEHKCFVDSAN